MVEKKEHEYGRKKGKSTKGNAGPITQTSHYNGTALESFQSLVLGKTYKGPEGSS